jgi:CTP synthase
MQKKYIFVTGGVCSSLGKGLTAAAIGLLMERQGYGVALLKLDPYLNIDPGTMSPYQHGEVYVTDDGAETDLDLGHYYRFTNSPLSKASNATSGQIYDTVIKRERRGDYLGKTVQVIPHITNEIRRRIVACGEQNPNIDLVIVEIGGTAGDIESLPFLEAIRQFCNENKDDCINIHLTYVPHLKASGEVKTKPTQHSVQVMRSIGLFPDIIICRCEEFLEEEVKAKISLFCNVPLEAVIDEPDVKHSIYEVPLDLQKQQLEEKICRLLTLPHKKIELDDWNKIVNSIKNPKKEITVGIIGKYVQHKDAYKSLYEALHHAAIGHNVKLNLKCIEADKIPLDGDLDDLLQECSGYLVPGGYGERGWLGKIRAAQYARERKIPYLGICFGMQVMAVEYARNVLGLKDANSTEIDPYTKNPIITLLNDQHNVQDKGGTMRLGDYPCALKKGSKAHEAYGQDLIHERHRHRYEFNNKYLQEMENKGMSITGKLANGSLCEIVEVKEHPWMVGVQYHPEFKSKPVAPHPLFSKFVGAMLKKGSE